MKELTRRDWFKGLLGLCLAPVIPLPTRRIIKCMPQVGKTTELKFYAFFRPGIACYNPAVLEKLNLI